MVLIKRLMANSEAGIRIGGASRERVYIGDPSGRANSKRTRRRHQRSPTQSGKKESQIYRS